MNTMNNNNQPKLCRRELHHCGKDSEKLKIEVLTSPTSLSRESCNARMRTLLRAAGTALLILLLSLSLVACSALSELSASNHIAKAPVMMHDDVSFEFPNIPESCKVLGSDILRSQIFAVTFLNTTTDVPEDCWDVSANGDRSVLAWVEENGAFYNLYIAGEGGINASLACPDLFNGYSNLIQISFNNCFYTKNAVDMSGMFDGCSSLAELDVSSFDTSKVTDMERMFHSCESLTNLDVSSFDTSRVTNMNNMFSWCTRLSELDLSSFDTSKVTDMNGMFTMCTWLSKLNLSCFDTSSVTDMSCMFYECNSFTELDLSNFDTSRVTNMSEMFSNCRNLTTLDLTSFNTANVLDMNNMFAFCVNLVKLDVSSFDTSKVKNMFWMFFECGSLTELDLSGFDTSNVTEYGSFMSQDTLPNGQPWAELFE